MALRISLGLLALAACHPMEHGAPGGDGAPAGSKEAAHTVSALPMPPVTGDPCPLEHTLASVDLWPGCPNVEPFFGEEAILNLGSKPCRESVTVRAAEDVTSTFERDASGRLLRSTVTDKGAPVRSVTYAYDPAGRLIGEKSDGRYPSRHTYERDAHGRLVRETTEPQGYDVAVATFTREGDLVTRIEQISGKDSFREVISYAQGLPVRSDLTTISGGRTWQTTSTAKRDAQGRRTELTRSTTFSDGVVDVHVLTFAYDARGRLASLHSLQSGAVKPAQTYTKTFRYDAAGILTSIEGENDVRRYDYDCAR